VVKLRVSGDYLQTSAVVRDGKVISAVNDPNDYTGPGTGYRLGEKRRDEIMNIRDVLDREAVLRDQNRHAKSEARRIVYRDMGPADIGNDPAEVVIGISPAFGLKLFQTTAGHSLAQVLKEMTAGIKAKDGKPRIVRFRHTADTSFLGLSAAGIAGSGIGIGIQAKGTAVIHQRGRLPHNNLELFSNAPITTLEHYRRFGENAATYAKGEIPDPVVVPTKGQAMGARFHAQTALIYAIETSLTEEGAKPENIEIKLLEGAA